jgi:hypothetical protein
MANGSVARYDIWQPITISDTVNIDLVTMGGGVGGPWVKCTDAIWVGGAGIVAAVMQNDVVVNFTCTAGTELRIAAKRVNATNTTATLLVALYHQ